jgi:hypothetical protein
MTFLEVAVILAEKEDRVSDTPYLLMLIDRIKLWRNSIIRQTLKANPSDINYYLTSYEAELIKVPSFETGYDIGCNIFRTKNKIYPSLRVLDYLYMVSNVDYTYNIARANNDVSVSMSRKYTGKDVFFKIRNEYIYIYNDLSLTAIGITDCLEFPEIIDMNKLGVTIENMEIKTTDDVIQKIISAIWAEDLRVKDTTSEEQINNVKQE